MTDLNPTGQAAKRSVVKPPEAAATVSQMQASIQTSRTGQPMASSNSGPVETPMPKVFGRYKIEKELGKGAMGVVYLAEDTQLGRNVALKIPKKSVLDEPDALERFYREAKTTSQIRHANICPVFDVGAIDGVHYLTMAYIPGKPVNSFLGKGKLPAARQVALLIRKIAQALDEAHRQGVVHRDLKPSNVMLDDRGEPIVMDFGLACQMNTAENARLTQSGAILGTPAYMAPEQVRGELDQIGPQSDIYALGVMLYQFLTGELPFTGPIMMVFAQILSNEPKRPSEVRPDVDPTLEAICLKMIAKELGQRFASMKDVAAALTEYLKTGSVTGLEPLSSLAPTIPAAETEPNFDDLPELQSLKDETRTPRLRKRAKSPANGVGGWWRQARKSAWFLPVVGVLVTLPLIALLAVVIYVTTGEGTVMIEVDDPSIKVTIEGQDMTFDETGQSEPIKVRAGRQSLAISHGGLQAETKSFTLSKGETKRLTVTWVDGKPELSDTPPEPPGDPSVPLTEEQAEQAARLLTETHPAENPSQSNAANNGWTDMLPNVELVPGGKWLKQENQSLVGFGGGPQHWRSRLLLPVTPKGSYEVEVRFQLGPIPPEEVILLNLPVGNREATFGCLPLKPKITGLARIQGRTRKEQRKTDATIHKEFTLKSDTVYQLTASVAVAGDQGDVLISLDGAPWVSWKGPLADLSRGKGWIEPRANALGLDIGIPKDKKGLATIIVSAIRYRELSGGRHVSQQAFPAGAIYKGTWRYFPAGSKTATVTRNASWTVTKRTGEFFEADYTLEQPEERWIDKGQVTSHGSGNGTVLSSEIYDVGMNHRRLPNARIVAELTEGGKKTVAITFLENGDRTEFEGTLANAQKLAAADDNAGWIDLFNGKNLTGWTFPDGLEGGDWTVRDGVLHGSATEEKPTVMRTAREDFQDFRLRLEIRSHDDINNAVLFRTSTFGEETKHYFFSTGGRNPDGQNGVLGLGEYGLLNRNESVDTISIDTAGLRELKQPAQHSLSNEVWHVVEITAIGNEFHMLVDGQEVSAFQDLNSTLKQGRVGVWLRKGSRLDIRKIEIQELPPHSAQDVKPAAKPAPPPAIAPFNAQEARAHQDAWAKHLGVPVEWENSMGMKFVLIPPGEYVRGNSQETVNEQVKFANPKDFNWVACVKSEFPQHRVVIQRPFYLGVTEVTQGAYEGLIGSNPSYFCKTGAGKAVVTGKDTSLHPVEQVGWGEILEFCRRLNVKDGITLTDAATAGTTKSLGYRLPTEGEWELACRAGSQTKYWCGDKDQDLIGVAWYGANSKQQTHPVGKLAPNSFGLYDILGNVFDRCEDGWNPEFYKQFADRNAVDPLSPLTVPGMQIIRGSDWNDGPLFFRSSARYIIPADFRAMDIGFRVAISVDGVKQTLAKTDNASAPPPAVAPFDAQQARAHQEAWAKHLGVPVEYANSLGMKFVLIPPGEFLMGSTPAEIDVALKVVGSNKVWQDCIKSEAPKHKVILTQPIYLGINEVTQAQYEKMMGKNPSYFAATGAGKDVVAGIETTRHPVENVSWGDVAEFCAKLSQQEGLKPFYLRDRDTVTLLKGNGYRLPTEAEWEFACRAGTTTRYWFGDQDEDLVRAGWFGTNSGGRPHAVGELKANPFGLYDLNGNVWERVEDWWDPMSYGKFQEKPAVNPSVMSPTGSMRVMRGGNYKDAALHTRSSHRHAYYPTYCHEHVGCRAALTVDAVKQALVKSNTVVAPPPAKIGTSPQTVTDGWPGRRLCDGPESLSLRAVSRAQGRLPHARRAFRKASRPGHPAGWCPTERCATNLSLSCV